MSDDRFKWEDRLKEPPFVQKGFTDELRMRVRREINATPGRQTSSFRGIASLLAVAACLVIGIFWAAPAFQPAVSSPEPRQSFYKDGKLLLQVFPDPELKAGQSYGYIFSFSELDGEVDKTLAIEAVHLATGRRETVVKPYMLTPEAIQYQKLGSRYTAFAALPIGGYWRYEVLIDGELYADVVLDVGEPSWEPSGTFTAGSYSMTGIEGKVGFIDPGFVAGHSNKYMWHFWGSEEELDGQFEVLAVKQGSMEFIPVFDPRGSLGGENNGADRHLPSSMMLPEPGLWRLLPYVDGKLIESIVVEVKDE